MKTKILKLLGLIAIVVSIMASMITPMASTDLSKSEFTDKYLEKNVERVELAKKVTDYIYNYYGIKDAWKDTYPEFYGGMYISDDANNLILQIVKDKIPNESSKEYSIYKEIISMDKSIKIEYVINSFNELNNANNQVSDYFESYNAKSIKVNSSYIDVMQNAVVVELVNNSKNQQEDFKKSISNSESFKSKDYRTDMDYELIVFQQGVELNSQADLKPGGLVNLTAGGCSMGYRTKYNGKAGYMTAGHCVYAVGDPVNTGVVRVEHYRTNQNYDYAFIETNSSWTPTNNLAYTKTNYTKLDPNSYSVFVTNTAIAKAGNTTGYTEGKVTGLNSTVTYLDGITLKGMVKSNVHSDRGDSGGVVFVPQKDADGGSIAIGILSGGGTSFLGLVNVMYFTNLLDLPSPLGVKY